nr:MAG TPA: Protein of unknown function (DUF2977) [Caudoviricetes sp.]
MKALLDEKGFIKSYAIIGDLVDGIDLPNPEDINHFAEHFTAYKVRDGTAIFDTEQEMTLQNEAVLADLRSRREKECFSVINRGQLWYEGVSLAQLLELRKWYKDWLAVTETKVVPDKPTWLT